MKYISGSIVAIIWGAVFGVIVGYVGGQLEVSTMNYGKAAIIGAVVGFVATNCLFFITSHANPEGKTAKK